MGLAAVRGCYLFLRDQGNASQVGIHIVWLLSKLVESFLAQYFISDDSWTLVSWSMFLPKLPSLMPPISRCCSFCSSSSHRIPIKADSVQEGLWCQPKGCTLALTLSWRASTSQAGKHNLESCIISQPLPDLSCFTASGTFKDDWDV